jgi:hypothetical protein
MGRYDRHGKWLIGQHGDAILRLGGLAGEIVSWRAAQAEVVEPTKLPDGLLEVQLAGRDAPLPFIVELMTYPDRRVYEQLHRDAALVYAQRGVLPEILVVVLFPKGQVEIAPAQALASPLGWTGWEISWRVVQLWQVPEAELWALNDPGVIPWVPLCHLDRDPEAVLEECRQRIEHEAPPQEQINLLAVTQVFTWLRFNDNRFLERLGDLNMSVEAELLREYVESRMGDERFRQQLEWQFKQALVRAAIVEDLLSVLDGRFGPPPSDLVEQLEQIRDETTLKRLVRMASRCQDLAAFRAALQES